MNDRIARAVIALASLAIFSFLTWLVYLREPGSGGEGGATSLLPAFNAGCNALCIACLVAGYRSIRAGDRGRHQRWMLAGLAASTAFLVGYVVHHFQVGDTRFAGTGWVRPVYFAILISHIVLTLVAVPAILSTLRLALVGRFAEHRRLARWTLPVWLYVSVTGVLVFAFLRVWS